MTVGQLVLLGAVGAPWLAALAIFMLGEGRGAARTLVGLSTGAAAVGCSILVGVQAAGAGPAASIGTPLLGARLALTGDRLGALFAVVASVLWLVTTVYATGYMSHAQDKARFFGFFAVCVGAAVGIALSANLLTLFVFYEVLTLATYPLVVHNGTTAAIKGGRTYLVYALTGGVVLALGVIWLYALGGGADFASGGTLPPELVASRGPQLTVVFALLIAGFGVKAALFPAHGWLPAAMVAPAPVSALLHAVAVVKAGVFGIARVVLDVFGFDVCRTLGVLTPLAALAAFTIIFASVRALGQDDIKKRLAYSTIGQLSYIVLGLAIGTPIAAAAAIAHLAYHAVLKITMFFTAGVLAEELKIHRVSQMDGLGRRMPLTMLAFSVAALGIVGVPPIAGFVTKWGLGMGGLAGGELWPLLILGVSSLLNAAYLMPMLGRAWFGKPRPEWVSEPHPAAASQRHFEGDRRMVVPLALTAATGLVLGPLAGAPWAPSAWAAAITGAPLDLVIPWPAGSWGLDVPGAFFLALALIVWLAAGVASWRPRTPDYARFRVFFALSAFGSIALAFAEEPAVFYTCFSVMALAAYGLVSQEGTPEAQRAGRSYLSFTLFAEALLLMGLLVGSLGTGPFAVTLLASPWRDLGIAALLVAFGVKIGTPALSGWMPGAYRAVPPGVGAAVAGVVSSAGVIGLLRFMPGGVVGLPAWGSLVAGVGVIAAFYGVLVGVVQRHPRHVLAYSSMSQFGLMTIGVGVGLSAVDLWPAALAAVSIYMTHHGFAKAALFTGNDVCEIADRKWPVLVGMGLAALSIAGALFTSGSIAKVALKSVTAGAPEPWATVLELALPLAAVGTTLLVCRLLYLVWSRPTTPAAEGTLLRTAHAAAFGVLVVCAAGFLWLPSYEPAVYAAHKSLTAHYAYVLTWPVVAGLILSTAAFLLRRRLSPLIGIVPPGDLWAWPMAWADEAWIGYQQRLASGSPGETTSEAPSLAVRGRSVGRAASEVERRLLTWPVAAGGIVMFALIVLLLAR